MIRTATRRPRKGSVALETMFVYPAFLGLVIGGTSVGLGVSRHQELSRLAQESARWASLQPAEDRTPAKVMANVVAKRAALLKASSVTAVVSTSAASNTTTVKLTYPWTFEFLPGAGAATLRSQATARGVD